MNNLYVKSRTIYLNESKQLKENIKNSNGEKEIQELRNRYATLLGNIIFLRGGNFIDKTRVRRDKNSKYTETNIKKSLKYLGEVKIIHKSTILLLKNLKYSDFIDKYKSDYNQIKLAKDFNISHLLELYLILSSLGYFNELNYSKIQLSVKSLEKIIEILFSGPNIDKYFGNFGQIELAKKVGTVDLEGLYDGLNALGYIELLSYTKIKLPLKHLEKLIIILNENAEKYKGNENQIKLAKEAGINNLSELHSSLSVLGYTEILGYIQIMMSIEELENFSVNELKEIFIINKIFKININILFKKCLESDENKLFILSIIDFIPNFYYLNISYKRFFTYIIKNLSTENILEFTNVLKNPTKYIKNTYNLINLDENYNLSELQEILIKTSKNNTKLTHVRKNNIKSKSKLNEKIISHFSHNNIKSNTNNNKIIDNNKLIINKDFLKVNIFFKKYLPEDIYLEFSKNNKGPLNRIIRYFINEKPQLLEELLKIL